MSLASTDVPGQWRISWEPKCQKRTGILMTDISGAYFNPNTDADRPAYVDLPLGHPERGTTVGLLLQHMYGTLSAADGWQQEYSCSLVEMSSKQGMSSPCVSRHRSRHVVCVCRGDCK